MGRYASWPTDFYKTRAVGLRELAARSSSEGVVSTAERNLLLEIARLITCMWLSAEDHITLARLIVEVQSEQKT
jgi:hypothetical protein